MARINSGDITGNFEFGDQSYVIHDTEIFENESFGFPDGQIIPTDHFEVKHFTIIGAIASGKTTLADRYYGARIKQLWGEEVDFYKVYDLYATIEAIKASDKLIHYVILDDFISKLDSRRSMSSRNVDMTELYYEIRHELAKAAEESCGLKGGLVILAILTQDHKAIDKRIRDHAMFNVFKTYDKSCDELIVDPEVIDLLKELKDRSVRLCDYEARKYAVGVDAMGFYALFYADRDKLPAIEDFAKIKGESRIKEQKDRLIQYLIEEFDLMGLSNEELKAELYFKLDEWEDEGEKLRIGKDNFSEIICKAKRIYFKESFEFEDEDETYSELTRVKESVKKKIGMKTSKSMTVKEQIYLATVACGKKFFTVDEVYDKIGIGSSVTRSKVVGCFRIESMYRLIAKGVYCLCDKDVSEKEIEAIRKVIKTKEEKVVKKLEF